jgi:hypothetical protein
LVVLGLSAPATIEASSDDPGAPPKRSTTGPDARRTRYLTRHATLSRDDYEVLFSGPCGQRNSADCYLLAALGSIPMTHREALFRTSIKADDKMSASRTMSLARIVATS